MSKFYRNLADLIFEMIKAFHINPKIIKERFKINNIELLEKYYSQERQVVIIIGHYANWEMGGLALSMATKYDVLGIFRPVKIAILDSWLLKSREKFGMKLFNMKEIMKKLVNKENGLFAIASLSDQTPNFSKSLYWTQFMNQETAVFLGSEKMAKMLDAVVIFGHINRVKRGYYESTFTLLEEHPNETKEFEITEKHIRFLENIIKQKPEDWLWSHPRWKQKRN